MKKFVLVYNPVSGNATFRQRLDFMIEAFQKRGAVLIPYRTTLDDSGLPAFLRAAEADGVLSAGGDGTLHEVVNMVAANELDLPIAIIGSGTSNDFATYLQVNDNIEEYFDHIVAGRKRPVDVGLVNGRYFINVASAGMLTSVAHEVNIRLKHAMGKMAYYLTGLGEIPRFRSMKLEIEADGKKYQEEAFLFVVVNSSVAAGIKNVAALAKVDDGKLDLLVVRRCNIPDFMVLTANVVAGKVSPDDTNVLYLQAKDFHITAADEVESDLDGELGPELPLRITTKKQAIQVFY